MDGEQFQLEDGMELFSQDGVVLKSASANLIQYLNTCGTLNIVEYPNTQQSRYVEWKANDITVEAEEMEADTWAVVRTRGRTTSESAGSGRKVLRVALRDVRSYRVGRRGEKLAFNDAAGRALCSFVFQHGSAECLVAALRGGLLPAVEAQGRRERGLYLVVQREDVRSFAQLDLFPGDSTEATTRDGDYVWKWFRNLHSRPYETTMEAFSKLTDIIYRGPDIPDARLADEDVEELLTRSLRVSRVPDDARLGDEYELVSGSIEPLGPVPEVLRTPPLTSEQWEAFQDPEGRILDSNAVRKAIFKGGLDPLLRPDIWPFLLDVYPWESTKAERQELDYSLKQQYEDIRVQWNNVTPLQESRHGEFRERRSRVDKDVCRTDRASPFYAGENNPNTEALRALLMSHVMYNFDLGYVQGMSDLASPLLRVSDGCEYRAFWLLAAWLDRVGGVFERDQAEIKAQLAALSDLLALLEPSLHAHLRTHDSQNMFFCFRWLLVVFRRELRHRDVCSLWEVLWTRIPCRNFQLLIAAAILQQERDQLMQQRSFAAILKHVNELSGHIRLQEVLARAEGLHMQLMEASHLPASLRTALGFAESVNSSPDTETAFQNALDFSYT